MTVQEMFMVREIMHNNQAMTDSKRILLWFPFPSLGSVNIMQLQLKIYYINQGTKSLVSDCIPIFQLMDCLNTDPGFLHTLSATYKTS